MRRGVGKQRDLDVTQASVDDIVAQIEQTTGDTAGDLQAQLDEARYQVEQTVVYAPSDGHVVQLALRPGMIATPFMYRPVMTFIPQRRDRLCWLVLAKQHARAWRWAMRPKW